ncbi:MAG: sporulation protein YqfD [Schaedlerella sp.]|nr:sporulation protein YqfD [Schaedlerella sp.]
MTVIQAIIRYFKGYVKICVQGYGTERFLNLCRYHNIGIWGLIPCGNSYVMYMSLADVRKLRPIIRKTRIKFRITGRYGLAFFLHRYRKRKVFFAGMLLFIILLYGYSERIWDIDFVGNEFRTDETLYEFLHSAGVSPGMKKDKADCEQIVKDLRQEYNDIVWVSASIDGSRLLIQVKENEDIVTEKSAGEITENSVTEENMTGVVQPEEADDTPTDLIASEDGIITSIITRSGVPQVHVGDSVKKGDLLVSARVEVLNDSGEVINYRYRKAEADILADTQMVYQDSISTVYDQKNYEENTEQYRFFLTIGDYRITAGFFTDNKNDYELFTYERQMKLGENFYLPFFYGYQCKKSYTINKKTYTNEQIRQKLTEKFLRFSEELEEKGIHIYENNVKIHLNQDTASAEGILFLNQDIGEEAAAEMIEIIDSERNKENESTGTDD